MLTCPEAACGSQQPHVGALTAHLVEQHLISAGIALTKAREAANGTASIDPTSAGAAVAKSLGVNPDHPMVL
ncbi:MAG: hypothetical protein ACREKH_11505, partial [Candidatus Rokuibacteriota bacterium]